MSFAEPAVGGLAARGPAAPGCQQPERVPGHRGIGGKFVQGRTGTLGEQEEDRAQGGQHQVAGQRGQQRPGGQVAGEDHQRVVPVLPPGMRRRGGLPPVPGAGLDVVDDGAGDHPDPVASRLHPPAEVGVLPEQPHARVEPTDLVPHIAAGQHAGAAHGEDVTVPVVLALIGLAGFDAGDPAARPVDGQARLEQQVPVGPVADLRAEHRGGGRLPRTGQQLLERVGRGLAVVVEQPHPLGPLVPGPARRQDVGIRGTVAQCLGDGDAVTGAALHPEHRRAAERLREHRAAAVPAAGVDGDNPLYRPALVRYRLRDMRQPRGTVMGDDHRGNNVLAVRAVW